MRHGTTGRKSVLMIAYTNYRTDPRVIRAAEAAASAGFDVDFIALRRADDPPEESINGVRADSLEPDAVSRRRRLLVHAFVPRVLRAMLLQDVPGCNSESATRPST